ncbi:hypothetical protein DFJ74DRAFT_683764 [Hyaloraphidium curvatum]|nr:hypothetical protein DFJ74DRAFT_683764 [Hyaloraphidium curvatum]
MLRSTPASHQLPAPHRPRAPCTRRRTRSARCPRHRSPGPPAPAPIAPRAPSPTRRTSRGRCWRRTGPAGRTRNACGPRKCRSGCGARRPSARGSRRSSAATRSSRGCGTTRGARCWSGCGCSRTAGPLSPASSRPCPRRSRSRPRSTPRSPLWSTTYRGASGSSRGCSPSWARGTSGSARWRRPKPRFRRSSSGCAARRTTTWARCSSCVTSSRGSGTPCWTQSTRPRQRATRRTGSRCWSGAQRRSARSRRTSRRRPSARTWPGCRGRLRRGRATAPSSTRWPTRSWPATRPSTGTAGSWGRPSPRPRRS